MSRRIVIPSVVAFLVLTGLIITLSPHNMRRVQAGFLGLISPFLKTGSSVEKKYREFREGLKTLDQLEEENKSLNVINKDLSATNQTLRGLEGENNELRKALQYRERSIFTLKPARIIGRDSSTYYNKVVIDRGSGDGLDKDGDQPVLTEAGLVGKTKEVAEHSATVVLIADEACRVSANVEGTQIQGIVKGERVSGTGSPNVELHHIPKTANLQPGQQVFSSGAGGVFPSGVLIGQVKEFKAGGLDGHATLIPAVDLTTLEDVFVVLGKNK